MSTIKTWAERAESLSDDTVVTSLHLAQFKQDEIDGLRSENARLRSALMGVAAAHAWLAFGECRAFGTDTLLTSAEADKVARAALGEK